MIPTKMNSLITTYNDELDLMWTLVKVLGESVKKTLTPIALHPVTGNARARYVAAALSMFCPSQLGQLKSEVGRWNISSNLYQRRTVECFD